MSKFDKLFDKLEQRDVDYCLRTKGSPPWYEQKTIAEYFYDLQQEKLDIAEKYFKLIALSCEGNKNMLCKEALKKLKND